MLNGIDISSYQSNIDLNKIKADFVIVKATQGTSYINPYFKSQIESAINNNCLIGLYHYADGKSDAESEAKFFLKTVSNYINKAILILDWETGSALNAKNYKFDSAKYAEQFLDYINKKTNSTPFIYMSLSVAREGKWVNVAKKYPLWMAAYNSKNIINGYNAPKQPTNIGCWSSAGIYQYSDKGRLSGYSGNLDINAAYITRAQWEQYSNYKKEYAGILSVNVVYKMQRYFNSIVDGVISNQPASNKKRVRNLVKDAWEFKNKNYADGSQVVKKLQETLYKQGYYNDKVDGWFGKNTIKALQKKFKLTKTGYLNKNTVKKLEESLDKGTF